MLSHFFDSTARIKQIRSCSFGKRLEEFAGFLRINGYADLTARRHIRSAEHLAVWASGNGISINELDDITLEHFGSHLKQCRCGRYSCAYPVNILSGARLFLRYSQGADTPAIRESAPPYHKPLLLQSFCDWMRQNRGTTEQTLNNYGRPIEALIHRFGDDMSALDARDLRNFVLERSQSTGWAATKSCTTALRMFLRFLTSEGLCRTSLLGAIPVIAHWRLSSLPKYLLPEDVERVIDSCDLSFALGKRDRAILLLLARLGLRAGDIVKLRLHDIDWKDSWVQVSGKNRRQTQLPLSQEVGEAIVSYVQDSRPCTQSDALFLRSRAPHREFASHAAVSVLVARAMRRAGIEPSARGAAHLLRHSLASTMLRQGASLQQISTLLRHQSIDTTQIYAKIDVTVLQQIAQPWPETPSC